MNYEIEIFGLNLLRWLNCDGINLMLLGEYLLCGDIEIVFLRFF